MRAMNLANALVLRGHEVVIFSADFDHQKKLHRHGKSKKIIVSERLSIQLISSPGYKKNMGFMRLLDHFILAINLNKLLKMHIEKLPDLVFIGYPPIETAFVMVRWLRRHNIPSVIDVKDQWPDLFFDSLPAYSHFFAKLILTPYFYAAKKTMSSATAFCSMSNSFLKWMSNVGNRQLEPRDIVAPLTVPLSAIGKEELTSAEIWWMNLGVTGDSKRRLCFVGSLSPAFDFASIHKVALEFLNEGIDCQFVICGSGSAEVEFRGLLGELSNVIFAGWVDLPKIHVLAKCSSASLAPYKNTKNFIDNIPNKIVDSLAHGLPILTTLSGEVKEMIENANVGIYYSSSDSALLKRSIINLIENDDFQSKLSNNALKLYSDKFSAEKVYGELVDKLEGMVIGER
jgi:glycosyltransferase involved in cell wall biosynthesis